MCIRDSPISVRLQLRGNSLHQRLVLLRIKQVFFLRAAEYIRAGGHLHHSFHFDVIIIKGGNESVVSNL